MARTRFKKRGLKGASIVRRLLRDMPDAMRGEIVDLMQEKAPAALAIARGGAPARTGALRAALSVKVYPKAVRLRVGLLGKAVNRRLFYGRILEAGRRAQTVNVRRRTSSGVSSYALRVSPISNRAYDMVEGPAKRQIRSLMFDQLHGIWERALRKAAMGGLDG